MNRSSDVLKEDPQLLEEVVKVGHSMDTLRNALLDQQNFVRHLIENSKQQPSAQSFKKHDQAYNNKNQNNDDKELLSSPATTTTHRNISSSPERSSKLNNSLTLPNPAQDEVLTHQGLGDGISARWIFKISENNKKCDFFFGQHSRAENLKYLHLVRDAWAKTSSINLT